MPIVVAVLVVSAILTHRAGYRRGNDILGYITVGFVTVDLLISVGLLISRLPDHRETPLELLKAAAGLWFANVIVFASWYWRLDGGGPNRRERRQHHNDGAFLFPQMTLTHTHGWRPNFVDYLFLAFNTSTAFSPTDAPVLTRWAKLLMMVQASISLSTIAVLAARAVNVL